MTDYVVFLDLDGKIYSEKTGSGKHRLIEIIEHRQLAIEYNDVRNDPYFIVK